MYALNPFTIRIRLLPKLLLALSLLGTSLSATTPPSPHTVMDKNKGEQYINKYLSLAQQEREVAGIPIAIKLAQGMLESSFGESELAVTANNHFGIKCKEGWDGLTSFQKDGGPREVCFRSYALVRESYQDHSVRLKLPHYKAVRSIPVTDYEGWAYALKDAGYAEDAKYAEKLISLIERFSLYRYDLEYEAAKKREDEAHSLKGNQIVIREIDNRTAVQDHLSRVEEEMKRRLNAVEEIAQDAAHRQGLSAAAQAAIQQEQQLLQEGLEEVKAEVDYIKTEVRELRRGQLSILERQSDIQDAVAEIKGDPFYNIGTPAFPEGTHFPIRKADARGVFYINGREAIAADGEKAINEYATLHHIELEDLLRYNDLEISTVMSKGYYIFLEPKRNQNDQAPETHQVQAGETMHSIAALYGLRLQRLLQRNQLKDGEQPQVNEYIFLNTKSSHRPKVKTEAETSKYQRFIRAE